MGWTGIYTGTMTRKERIAFMDKSYTWRTNAVIKSTLVGTTYYAAVKDSATGRVWAGIALTRMKKSGEFVYKDMDESLGPFQGECPISIINLLTPTDSEHANNWRKSCKEYAEKKKIVLKQNYLTKGSNIGYVVCLSACNTPTYVKKLTKKHMWTGEWENAHVYTKDKAEKIAETIQNCYVTAYKPVVKKVIKSNFDGSWELVE